MANTFAWIFRKIPQWECSAGVFILKANFERFTSNSLIQGVIQQSFFPALPCVLLLVACFAEKRQKSCFFSGHNALLLIRHAHT